MKFEFRHEVIYGNTTPGMPFTLRLLLKALLRFNERNVILFIGYKGFKRP